VSKFAFPYRSQRFMRRYSNHSRMNSLTAIGIAANEWWRFQRPITSTRHSLSGAFLCGRSRAQAPGWMGGFSDPYMDQECGPGCPRNSRINYDLELLGAVIKSPHRRDSNMTCNFSDQTTNFAAGGADVLFFSRGRGRGHAIPDMALATELRRLIPGVKIGFVSYGTGAETLRDNGYKVTDLGIGEDSPLLETIIQCTRALGRLRPSLVVAHEEFGALPAGEVFRLPTLFVTDWFSDPNSLFMLALKYAKEVIFIQERGIFTEPPYLKDKVHYVGPVVRQFEYQKSDAPRARNELGIQTDSKVIVYLPGSFTEAQAPLTELLVAAFDRLACNSKHLICIAGRDYEVVSQRFLCRKDITVRKEDWQLDRLIVASNLAITKGTRTTLQELYTLGIPSISISYGLNWIDDVLANRIPSNTPLDARSIDSEALASCMAQCLARAETGQRDRVSLVPNGMHNAAARIAHYIKRK